MIRRTIELTGSDSVKLTAMQYWNQPAVSLQIGKGRYVTIALAEARELAGWLIEHAAEDPDAQPTTAQSRGSMGGFSQFTSST